MAFALLRLPQVMARVGLEQTRLYQLVGDGEFPAPVRLGDRAIAWVEEEVNEWIRKKAASPRVRILTTNSSVCSRPSQDIEPEPLCRPLPPPEPYPLAALGLVLGAAARRIHEVVGAPAAICGQAVHAAASLASQAHADIEIDGRREILSLYCFTVGDSGERKTGVDENALAPHRKYERACFDEYRTLARAHEIEVAAHEAARRAISKGKKEARVILDALEELGEPPVPPIAPILLAQAPTMEGIHKLYAVGRPSIGLFHNDAGEFLGGHAMNEENRMKSAAGLSRLWDSSEFDRIRAADGAHKFFGRRLASHLMVQPAVAERVLSDDILTGQGLLARALMTWPISTIGDRPYVSVDLTNDPALLAYGTRITTLLERKPTYRKDTTSELEPRTLILTEEARAAWITIHDAIEADQRNGRGFASVRPWASKAASQVLRIAGVLTLIDNPNAGVVDREVIENATALVNHYLCEAVRLVGTASVPIEIRNAEALRDWCHRERRDTLHSRLALQYGPNCIRTVAAFNAAISVLERTYWAERIEGGYEIDGAHRRRAWWIKGVPP